MSSWIVLILPRIEQKSLHGELDFNISVLQQSRDTQTTHIPAIRCPSDGNSGGSLPRTNQGPIGPVARNPLGDWRCGRLHGQANTRIRDTNWSRW